MFEKVNPMHPDKIADRVGGFEKFAEWGLV